ncbi:hypothetical protein D3C75_806570 [compost metagenome]
MLSDNGRHFAANSACFIIFMHNQYLTGLTGSSNNRITIQRLQGTQIKNMCCNSFLAFQFFRSLHSKMQRETVANHRNIRSLTQQISFANWNGVIPFRYFFLDQLVTLFVLKEKHRIRITYGCFQQSFSIISGVRRYNLQSRCTKENRFWTL